MEVTIDDRLPCLGGKLCFSQCQTEDLFWLPLLEKAYAKYVNAVIGRIKGRYNTCVPSACLFFLTVFGIDLCVIQHEVQRLPALLHWIVQKSVFKM